MRNTSWRKALVAFASAAILSSAPLCYALATSAALSCVKHAPNGYVCLTIDDGYGRENIENDLEVLEEYNVQCTFFVIGSQLAKYPDLWQQAVWDGDEICYHTMWHKPVSNWSNAKILADLNQWNDTARSVLGPDYVIPKFARLPGGSGSGTQRILKLFDSLGYKVVYWSSDTLTGAVDKHIPIAGYIKSSTKPGSIILTHFNVYDVPALPQYIGWLQENFTLGTLSQAFASLDPPQDSPTRAYTPTHSESAQPLPSGTVIPADDATPGPEPTPEESSAG